MVDLAILDLLEEPNRIALDNSAGRKAGRSQHEAVDTIAVTTARADHETIRKRIWERAVQHLIDRSNLSGGATLQYGKSILSK